MNADTWNDRDEYEASALEARETMVKSCEHEFTVTETDNLGNEYTVCEECDEEVEPEDTRSFYRDPETGRITW